MHPPYHVRSVVLAVVAGSLALAVLWRFKSQENAPGHARALVPDPDCEVSECGADGVPLSSYAG